MSKVVTMGLGLKLKIYIQIKKRIVVSIVQFEVGVFKTIFAKLHYLGIVRSNNNVNIKRIHCCCLDEGSCLVRRHRKLKWASFWRVHFSFRAEPDKLSPPRNQPFIRFILFLQLNKTLHIVNVYLNIRTQLGTSV